MSNFIMLIDERSSAVTTALNNTNDKYRFIFYCIQIDPPLYIDNFKLDQCPLNVSQGTNSIIHWRETELFMYKIINETISIAISK